MKALIPLLAFALCPTPLMAALDGNELVKYRAEFRKLYESTPGEVDKYQLGQYVGYVIGIADAGNNKQFCIPPSATHRQLFEVVGTHLDRNPSSWHRPASGLVVAALTESFPCKDQRAPRGSFRPDPGPR